MWNGGFDKREGYRLYFGIIQYIQILVIIPPDGVMGPNRMQPGLVIRIETLPKSPVRVRQCPELSTA